MNEEEEEYIYASVRFIYMFAISGQSLLLSLKAYVQPPYSNYKLCILLTRTKYIYMCYIQNGMMLQYMTT